MPVAGALSVVVRRELFAALSAPEGAGVTVVAAPAGSGKTVLLRSWVESAGLRERVAWVSVAFGERDAQHFWLSVVSELRVAVGSDALVERLEPAPRFDGGAIVERLAAELQSLERPLVLVIDDLHELRSPEAQMQLQAFLARRPSLLRVVLATRRDPRLGLHRQRLAGDLTEIRTADLRFTVEEARELLAGAGVALSPDSLALLHERTEGWAAGLRLAALALTRHPEPERFVSEFSGSERTVADYLFAEVLERQPEPTRRLLLRTSILERVDGALADLLTGASGSQAILQELEQENAFVTSLDSGRSWFRYHHLFADLLRLELARTEPEAIPALHRAAAAWFAEHGDVVDAVRHAQAAGDWPFAARLLANHSFSLALDGRAATVDALLAGFPPGIVSSEPELAPLFAIEQVAGGSLADAEAYLALGERHAAAVAEERRPRFAVLLGVARLMLARRRGDYTAALAEAQPLLAAEASTFGEVGLTDDLRTAAFANLGIVELWSNRPDEAARHLDRALEQARLSRRAYLELQSLAHLAVAAGPRSFALARERAMEAIAIAEARGWGADRTTGLARLVLGTLAVWQAHFDDAEAWLLLAQQAIRPDVEPAISLMLYQTQGRLHLARGRDQEAADAFRAAARLEGLLVAPHMMTATALRLLALAQIRMGDLPAARATVAQLPGDERIRDVVRLSQAQLDLSEGRAQATVDALKPVLDGSSPSYRMLLVEALLVDAIAHDALGEAGLVEEDIERALELAAPDGVLWAFVVIPVRELLERHPRHRTAHGALLNDVLTVLAGASPHGAVGDPAPLREDLSDSELRVLRYLPSNLSARAIASELYLSTHTVKTHLRHIYAKLDVHTRAEAVARARELGLLGPSSWTR